MMSQPYEDERYCEHCEKDTMHRCIDGGHERDSSNDYQRCMLCGWYMTGMDREYQPPPKEHDDDTHI